jgi:hypothetical protein
MIQPPNGLSGVPQKPITIRALNDGKVLIDAQYQYARGTFNSQPAALQYNSWFVIEGINAAHGNYGVVGAGDGANNNIFRRVIAWDGAGAGCDQNSMPMGAGTNSNPPGSSDNVFEDVAAWGCGRKTFGLFRDTRTTVLRGFFMKTAFSGPNGVGGTPFTYAYDSIDTYVANTIVTQDLAYGGTEPDTTGIFDKDHYLSYDGPLPLTIRHTLRGNIVYVMDPQGRSTGTLWTMGVVMCGPGADTPAGLVVNVDAHNLLCMRRNEGWPREGINGIGVTGPGCDNVARNWTDSLGDLSAGTQTTDTGQQRLDGFQNGLLNLGASTQPSSGAWLRYRYNPDKSLSTTELWPWPMNERIKEALVASGYATRGLDGKGETDLTKLIFRLTGASNQGGNQCATSPSPTSK